MVDRLEDLAATVQNLTVYDVKSWYNKGKAFVMNYTEMETKVREATNDDPWGASSTLMAEIAQGTFNYQQFNEIMPTVYSRFMEKEARQWRQIFKALQLLEYLIKNGSERVVDDCRSHISTLKMLRSFHYIDDKGKDQGINIRHRSKEIAEMLSDLDAVRAERKKAKANRAKYQGESAGFGGTGKKYGGFGGGADQYGSYGDGGIGSSRTSTRDNGYAGGESSFHDHGRKSSFEQTQQGGFEEYDAGDEEDDSAKSRPSTRNTPSRNASMTSQSQPVVADLFSFDDYDSQPAPVSHGSKDDFGAFSTAIGGEDDFDDFQSAPAQSQLTSQKPTADPLPAPTIGTKSSFDLFLQQGPMAQASETTASGKLAAPISKPSPLNVSNTLLPVGGSQTISARPLSNSTASGLVMDRKGNVSNIAPRMTVTSANSSLASSTHFSSSNDSNGPVKPAASSDGFADLWASSKLASGTGTNGNQKQSMASLAQQNSASHLWSSVTPVSSTAPNSAARSKAANGLDDLLF